MTHTVGGRRLLYFACCEVLMNGYSQDLCWVCNDTIGISFWDTYGDCAVNNTPYRGGGTTIQFSQVKSEFLSRSTP